MQQSQKAAVPLHSSFRADRVYSELELAVYSTYLNTLIVTKGFSHPVDPARFPHNRLRVGGLVPLRS